MTDSGVDDDALVPVTVLLDREDDAHLTHTLLRAHTLASAVVTVHPTPGASTAAALADDLLLALGHSLDRAGADGASGPDSVWRAVTAWIRGDEIRHLIVLRAHRLSAAQHARLFRLRHDAGVHLVLVWHSRDPLAPRLAMPAGVRPHITDDLVALTGRLPPPRRDTPAPTDAAELPAVPDSDCATFLPAAAAALSRADYTRVAAVYHQGCRDDQSTAHRLRPGPRPGPADARLPARAPVPPAHALRHDPARSDPLLACRRRPEQASR